MFIKLRVMIGDPGYVVGGGRGTVWGPEHRVRNHLAQLNHSLLCDANHLAFLLLSWTRDGS